MVAAQVTQNPSRAETSERKGSEIRYSNMTAVKAVADAIRTSLGPRGMDKMIKSGSGDVTITNDGATILKEMKVHHPAAKMMVELAKAQDIEAGDGTTTVVVIAGSLLDQSAKLLDKGIHPSIISDAFGRASQECIKILEGMATPLKMSDRESLIKSASTALNSKVVSQYSQILAPLCVDAIMKVIDDKSSNVDLRDIKVCQRLGGTVEDTELVDGLVFPQKRSVAEMPTRVEKAKIGLIQFCVSPPKTDMENKVIIQDYTQMDRALKDERNYILNICKGIKKSGCNVLLIQKSILRDATNDLALHFLAKMKIMVITDIEREDIEFICKVIGCRPAASLDHFTPETLGTADLVEEMPTASGRICKITGVPNPGKGVSILVRGSNKLVIDEADRSIHDALCVIRCLVKKKALIAGGGAPEIEMALRLQQKSHTLASGMEQYCWRAYADGLEVVPYTLAENAGLNAIETVTELRNRHAAGEKTAGINVRKVCLYIYFFKFLSSTLFYF